jgi:hypothetical protein
MSIIRTIAICSLLHVIVITLLELKLGPFFCASQQGALEIASAAQLTESGERGISRLTGTFLTPNNLAFVPALLLLLILWTLRSRSLPWWYIVLYAPVGSLLALLGGSRSMLAFFCTTSAVLCWHKSRLASTLCLVLGVIAVTSANIDWAALSAFARLDTLDFSDNSRSLLWSAVWEDFTYTDWLFGAGLTFWSNIFGGAFADRDVLDPHNWVLSTIGMFGVTGLAFYVWLAIRLVKAGRMELKSQQALTVNLLILYFCKDLVSVQYLFNNHPNSCLSWLVLCLAISGAAPAVGFAEKNRPFALRVPRVRRAALQK